jgi:dUTPase
VVKPYTRVNVFENDTNVLSESERGSGGFGSSGR